MRVLLCLVIYLCVFNICVCQEQYFNALLANDKITLDGNAQQSGFPLFGSSADKESHISWGSENYSVIQLQKIQTNHNGNAEFTLQQTSNCKIGLLSTAGVFYGFEFIGANFSVLPDDQGMGSNGNYNDQSTFKIEKCEKNINYYKDGILLFSFCSDSNIGELSQFTEVLSAIGSEMFLDFFQNTSCESSNIYSGLNSEMSRSVTDLGETYHVNVLEKKIKPSTYLFIQIIDESGKYIRQYKKRSNSEGKIMGCAEIEKFIKGSNHRLNIIISE